MGEKRQRQAPAGDELLGLVGAPSRPVLTRGVVAVKRQADAAILLIEKPAKGYGAKLRNMTPDPLDYYYHRNQISRREHRAGNLVRVLHYAAHGSGYAMVNLDAFHGTKAAGDGWKFSSRQAHALHALGQLLETLTPDSRVMVERVVIWSEFANHVAERRLMLRPRLGIGLLRRALAHLDRVMSSASGTSQSGNK